MYMKFSKMLMIILYAEQSSGFDYRDTLCIMSDTFVVLSFIQPVRCHIPRVKKIVGVLS